MSTFDGDKFRALVKEKGFSMYTLARETGLSQSALGNIANGKVGVPKLSTLISISEVLGVPITELSCGLYDADTAASVGRLADKPPRSIAVCDPVVLLREWNKNEENNEELVFPASTYIRDPFSKPKDSGFSIRVGLEVADSAMVPEFRKGDIVICDMYTFHNAGQPTDGSYVACVLGDGPSSRFAIRRYEKGEGEDYWLVAINDAWRGESVHKNCPIAGVVDCIVRQYK